MDTQQEAPQRPPLTMRHLLIAQANAAVQRAGAAVAEAQAAFEQAQATGTAVQLYCDALDLCAAQGQDLAATQAAFEALQAQQPAPAPPTANGQPHGQRARETQAAGN